MGCDLRDSESRCCREVIPKRPRENINPAAETSTSARSTLTLRVIIDHQPFARLFSGHSFPSHIHRNALGQAQRTSGASLAASTLSFYSSSPPPLYLASRDACEETRKSPPLLIFDCSSSFVWLRIPVIGRKHGEREAVFHYSPSAHHLRSSCQSFAARLETTSTRKGIYFCRGTSCQCL